MIGLERANTRLVSRFFPCTVTVCFIIVVAVVLLIDALLGKINSGPQRNRSHSGEQRGGGLSGELCLNGGDDEFQFIS